MKFQINWTMYTPNIMTLSHNYCHNAQDIWLMMSHFICFSYHRVISGVKTIWHETNSVIVVQYKLAIALD